MERRGGVPWPSSPPAVLSSPPPSNCNTIFRALEMTHVILSLLPQAENMSNQLEKNEHENPSNKRSTRRLSISRTESIKDVIEASRKSFTMGSQDNRRKGSIQDKRAQEASQAVCLRAKDKEEESVDKNDDRIKTLVLHPKSLRLWDAILFLLQFWTVFTAPLDMFFEDEYCNSIRSSDFMWAFVWAIEILYVVDIAINFITMRVHGDEFHGIEVEYDRKVICLGYLKERFLLDLLGTLPIIALFRPCLSGFLST